MCSTAFICGMTWKNIKSNEIMCRSCRRRIIPIPLRLSPSETRWSLVRHNMSGSACSPTRIITEPRSMSSTCRRTMWWQSLRKCRCMWNTKSGAILRRRGIRSIRWYLTRRAIRTRARNWAGWCITT